MPANTFLLIILVLLQVYAFRRQALWTYHSQDKFYFMVGELRTSCIIGLLLSFSCLLPYLSAKIIITFIYLLLSIFLSIHIFMRNEFGLHFDINLLKRAFASRDTLSNNETSFIAMAKGKNYFNLIFFSLIYPAAFASIAFNARFTDFIYSLSIFYSIFISLKMRTSKWYNAILLLFTSIVFVYTAQRLNIGHVFENNYIIIPLALFLLLFPTVFKLTAKSQKLADCCVLKLFFSKKTQPDNKFKPNKNDISILEADLTGKKQSKFFKLCENANIILITLESVNDTYTKPNNYELMPTFQKYHAKSWASENHICLTPNTNGSFYTMYFGNYFNDSSHSYLNTLAQEGYQTYHLTTSCPDKFINKFNFQTVYDQSDIDNTQAVTEEQGFLQLLNKLKSSIQPNKKLFLHIINQQTHTPHSVFHSKPSPELFKRYLQATNESDHTVGVMLNKLQEFIDMENTIIVYTSDHGQSFGEMGYHGHSTSIIEQQIKIPFLIYHPKLHKRTLDFSSHFDVFPTLFDLLGIPTSDTVIGSSLENDHIPFSHVLFSEIRNANLPGVYGHINKERKIFIDSMQNIANVTDLNDKTIRKLDNNEKDYYRQLMLHALATRGLINRSYYPIDWF